MNTAINISIGNWYLVDGEPTKVTPENISYVLNTLCQTIPLTPEILLKIGFVKKDTFVENERYSFFYAQHNSKHDFVCRARFEYSQDLLCCEFNCYADGKMSFKIQSIKLLYLHQFQDAMRVCNMDLNIYLNNMDSTNSTAS